MLLALPDRRRTADRHDPTGRAPRRTANDGRFGSGAQLTGSGGVAQGRLGAIPV
jgi:hypothetical protein